MKKKIITVLAIEHSKRVCDPQPEFVDRMDVRQLVMNAYRSGYNKAHTELQAHMNNEQVEYIMCAAIHLDDGKVYCFQPYNINAGVVLCGWRHPCIFQQAEYFGLMFDGYTQGFLTTKNRFLSRDEAYKLARETGQLKHPLIGGTLTSEDLW